LSEFVQFSENDGVATIIFMRAEILNAIGLAEILAIYSQLRRWRDDDGITGVVLRGDGFRAFSVGENLTELHQALAAPDQAYLAALARGSHRLVRLWATYPKPTMAVMNGITMGVAGALAMES
jgi:enoyl-CoA hydratase